jgi:hypothetical protein
MIYSRFVLTSPGVYAPYRDRLLLQTAHETLLEGCMRASILPLYFCVQDSLEVETQVWLWSDLVSFTIQSSFQTLTLAPGSENINMSGIRWRQMHGTNNLILGSFDRSESSTTVESIHKRPELQHRNAYLIQMDETNVLGIRADDRGILLVGRSESKFKFKLVDNPQGVLGHYKVRNKYLVPITNQTFHTMAFILPDDDSHMRPIYNPIQQFDECVYLPNDDR